VLYVRNTALVEETIEDAIELFVELAASGYTKEALGMLVQSPAQGISTLLWVGLRLFIGRM